MSIMLHTEHVHADRDPCCNRIFHYITVSYRCTELVYYLLTSPKGLLMCIYPVTWLAASSIPAFVFGQRERECIICHEAPCAIVLSFLRPGQI